ncbi:MAG TPA: VOC family protein [Alphaproteobacteria bacterium]|nr:VOC family protein [Alphaproteobacteria bacterium]
MTEAKVRITPYAHVLAVPDLAHSARYFRDALGFRLEWEDGLNWNCLVRDGARVMIGHCPDQIRPAETGDHSYFGYFHVDDIDALHREIVARGAIVMAEPADKRWGMREMPVATPDGHRMMFGQRLRRG